MRSHTATNTTAFFCFARNCFSRNTTTEDKIAIGVMLFISRPRAYSRLLAYIHKSFIAVSVLRVHFAFYILQLAQRHCIVVCNRCPSVPDCQQGSSITTSSAVAEKLFSAPLSDTDLDRIQVRVRVWIRPGRGRIQILTATFALI